MELQSDLSKKYISESLFSLMEKKPYSNITNKDITDKAGLSHITIYRNFKNKEEIIEYYLTQTFNDWKKKWNEDKNIAYNFFLFFQDNKSILSSIYKNDLEHLLVKNILSCLDYKEDDINIAAYSKVSVAYLIFGWCSEWYKRGMQESPEKMSYLFEQQKGN